MPSVVVCGGLLYTVKLSPAEVDETVRQHWDRQFVIVERGTYDAKKKSFTVSDEVRLRVGLISAVSDPV